jgi:hypothetical protein
MGSPYVTGRLPTTRCGNYFPNTSRRERLEGKPRVKRG